MLSGLSASQATAALVFIDQRSSFEHTDKQQACQLKRARA
jgi:hypothetical protein